jgi:hypothetical protein
MEEGTLWYPEEGTPQGGVISPLLANIFLHEVLDTWFDQEVEPRLRGRAFMVRYADDAVLCFEREEDARRVLSVLSKRFGKYGLRLHPEKTRLVAFRRPVGSSRPGPGETFDMLGFTHFWGRSRKGNRVVMRKTAKDRLSRALKRLSQWCRRHRHWRVADQQQVLNRKLRGHYAYYGITGNGRSLCLFRWQAECLWQKWLNRRSYSAHLTWSRFQRLLACYPLAPPRVVHSIYRPAANP